MDIVADIFFINMETQGIIHRILLPLFSVNLVERRGVGLMAGTDPEGTGRGFRAGLSSGCRHGKLQHTAFIGPDPLFREIQQNVLAMGLCFGKLFRQRSIAANILHPLRLFDGHAGIDMPPVNPVKTGYPDPVFAVK